MRHPAPPPIAAIGIATGLAIVLRAFVQGCLRWEALVGTGGGQALRVALGGAGAGAGQTRP